MEEETPGARRPQRARGRERFDAIMEAAAEILIEQGVGGVTMNAVAKLSSTSVGSMYHFFPDRDALLAALRERQIAALSDIVARLDEIADERWRAMSASEVAAALFGELASYLQERPKSLPFLVGNGDSEGSEEFYQMIERVLKLRADGRCQFDVAKVSAALVATMTGVFLATAQFSVERAVNALSQVSLLLGAYLEKIEGAALASGSPDGPQTL